MDSRDCPLSYQSVAKENKANKQPSAWIEIPLVEGLESISSSIVCSNLDSGLSIVRFLIYPKDESTKAHLSAHQSIAVLPVGFRPLGLIGVF